MRYELDRRQEYRFSARELGPFARLQLALAEEAISTNADQLPDTIETVLAGRRVTIFGYGDLLIYIELIDLD